MADFFFFQSSGDEETSAENRILNCHSVFQIPFAGFKCSTWLDQKLQLLLLAIGRWKHLGNEGHHVEKSVKRQW